MKETGAVTAPRAGVYTLLAEALAPPALTGGALIRLTRGEWARELSEAMTPLGCPFPVPASLLRPSATPEALAEEYLQAFSLPHGLGIWLVESVYKPWTLDRSAELPFMSEAGWLGGDAASHLRDMMGELGIELSPEIQATPDHLSVELEIISLLVEEADPDAQATFLAQHLDWLPLLMTRCDEAGLGGFYRALLVLTGEFIAWDRQLIDPAGNATSFQGYPG
ncbi:MAG: molecular chaperone TorD family protein [Smithellaceae bacterium]|nr:molecular chaperone TorD family protein [Smithellaceae bacterium]